MGSHWVLSVVRVWFWLLVAATAAGALGSYAFAAMTPATYASKVILLVTPLPGASNISFSDVEVTQALAPTFAQLATTRPILQRVIATTGIQVDPDKLALAVSTKVPAGTSLIEISVSLQSATDAARVANEIALGLEQFPAKGLPSQPAGLRVALSVVEPATPSSVAQGPGTVLRVALGGTITLFLALGLAFVVENLRAARRPPGLAPLQEGRSRSPNWPA